jgi:hypothetical protein
MFSEKTLFPFSYYNIPVCGNDNVKEVFHELGEILTGHSIYETIYSPDISNSFCQIACKRKIDNFQVELMKWIIEQEYTIKWYADGLPAALDLTFTDEPNTDNIIHEGGIPVGEKILDDGVWRFKIYNHYTFKIFVNHNTKNSKQNEDSYSVVEFNIVPWR